MGDYNLGSEKGIRKGVEALSRVGLMFRGIAAPSSELAGGYCVDGGGEGVKWHNSGSRR